MMTALQAHNESKYNAAIVKLENKIDESIKAATEIGLYEVIIEISLDTADYVREALRKKLQSLGYECNIPPHEDMPVGCPSDQYRCCDTIFIKW